MEESPEIERMRQHRSQRQDMGDVPYQRNIPSAQMPPQGRPQREERVVRPVAFQQPPQPEEEEVEQRSLREMILDFLPMSVRIVGWGGISYSGIATTLFMYQMTGQFFVQPIIQTAIGVVIALAIFFSQAIAVSTPSKIGRDVYWISVGIDTVLTATLAHIFTMQIVEVYPVVPVVLMAASTYIGFRVTQRKWSTFQSAMTTIGIAAFFLIGQGVAGYYQNALFFSYVMWGVDIIGNFWVSRLGEEAALGRRLVWN